MLKKREDPADQSTWRKIYYESMKLSSHTHMYIIIKILEGRNIARM